MCNNGFFERRVKKLDNKICDEPMQSEQSCDAVNDLSDNVHQDDKQTIQQMLERIDELTQNVNELRQQVQSQSEKTDGEGPKEELLVSGQDSAVQEQSDKQKVTKKKKRSFSWIGEVLFYLVLVAIVAGAFLLRSNGEGRPTSIAGFSAFTVLTGSMESEIPQGSLVVVKNVEPNTLVIGDDITYMVSETSTITHRIIGITENYLDTGQRGFETKGIMNEKPDKEMVAAVNVVGKVVYHSKVLGRMATFASEHWPIIIFVIVVVVALFYVLKWILTKEEKPANKKSKNQ